jgi:hypothetical protein
MTKNEKCIGCFYHTIKGKLISSTETRFYDFCSFRGINLVNIIVKDCSIKDRLDENDKELREQRNKTAFENLTAKIDFFR